MMGASAPSATVVAGEIRRRCPGIGKTKLHKLLYYVQGYHLTWEDTPAFHEDIEAWDKGPVVAALWRKQRKLYVESTDRGWCGTRCVSPRWSRLVVCEGGEVVCWWLVGSFGWFGPRRDALVSPCWGFGSRVGG